MDERERALAEQEFLDHPGSRRPTAAHPLCVCVKLASKITNRKEMRKAMRDDCPVHGKATQ